MRWWYSVEVADVKGLVEAGAYSYVANSQFFEVAGDVHWDISLETRSELVIVD